MSSPSDPIDQDKQRVEEYEYSPNADPVSYQRYPTNIANPGPAGTLSFGATIFILSLYNLNARGVHAPNLVVGMAIFAGGLTQFIAGMWEFPRGNVFGATSFASYGAFWLSYATINIPASGIIASFSSEEEFHNAQGIYLATWTIISVFFLLAVIRRHVAFSVVYLCAILAFALLSATEFTGSIKYV
ncbi:hypothetical protein PQX77_004240 [Marasmius sp. AFHP31]|nr:hypothetical protein PQX77_004240 [Marasmius sp. AFHP31]